MLVINYGDNTVSRFTVSGEFDSIFINPGNDGLTELREIRFGHDGNLYVMGGKYGDISNMMVFPETILENMTLVVPILVKLMKILLQEIISFMKLILVRIML